MRSRNFKALTALLLLVCVVLMSFAGCSKKNNTAEVDTPKTETAAQSETLDSQNNLPEAQESTGLADISLSAAAWGDSNGAAVSFRGVPNKHTDGQTAAFVVRLNGSDVQSVPCEWDGTAYTASADLGAADGYSYLCIMTGADGAEDTVILSSPDTPEYDTLVYMQSSLNAYCNLFVADWEEADEKLNITSGYVQVQLPQITAAGTEVKFEGAQLVFQLNGAAIETQDLELPAGEGAGSYETALTSVSFDMPEMDDDYQLDLFLTVKLSNGEEIIANGGSWYYNNSTLNMIVG